MKPIAINVEKIKLRLEMMRGVKRTLIAKFPVDSLLWYVYDVLEHHHEENEEWGITIKQLRELKNDLVRICEDIQELEYIDENTKTTVTLVGDDGDDPQCGVITNVPETIGEWKSRLSKMQTLYHFDSEAVKLIQAHKEKLFDRTNIDKMSGQINSNNVISPNNEV